MIETRNNILFITKDNVLEVNLNYFITMQKAPLKWTIIFLNVKTAHSVYCNTIVKL